jgi:hypothetical protein
MLCDKSIYIYIYIYIYIGEQSCGEGNPQGHSCAEWKHYQNKK